MERSIFAAIFGGFLGILALGGLAFPPYGPEFDSNPQPFAGHTSTPSLLPKPEGDWRILDPVTYENISVFPVVAAYEQDAGASLNQLVLVNRSKRPLLLLAGELVSGGKQDRVIGKDRIVPVGAPPLPLDVFCVEHGRWSSGANFSAAKTIVHPSVREQAAVNHKQADVWNAVRSGTTASVEVSRTGTGAGNAAPEPRVSGEMLSHTM